jgi:hypothetical protein
VGIEKAGKMIDAKDKAALHKQSKKNNQRSVMTETPLYDLLESQWHYNELNHSNLDRTQRRIHDNVWREQCDKQRQVEELFGAINGWALTDAAFSPDAIGKYRSNWNLNDFEWIDHPIGYRDKSKRRNAAIVGQPYADGIDSLRDELDAVANEYGLRWHAAPMQYASIWYPGWTSFIVMTLPDIKVELLPEQENEPRFATKGGWTKIKSSSAEMEAGR